MYIYFLLFQDTGGKDDYDCKIEDDIMNFFFNHPVCDVPDIAPLQWFCVRVDDEYEEGLCYCTILLSLERKVKSLNDLMTVASRLRKSPDLNGGHGQIIGPTLCAF